MPSATMPATVAYASDASVRIMIHSGLVLSGTSNASTFQKTYAKLPPTVSPWLQTPAGILDRNFFDPNFYPLTSDNIPEGVDPTTVNGVAWASPYATQGVGLPISVVIGGITFVYIKGGGTIAAGDLLLLADAYGRVDNAANLGVIAGTKVFMVGFAQEASAATANLIVPIEVQIAWVTV